MIRIAVTQVLASPNVQEQAIEIANRMTAAVLVAYKPTAKTKVTVSVEFMDGLRIQSYCHFIPNKRVRPGNTRRP